MKKSTIRHTLFISFSSIILISFLTVAAISLFFEMPKQKERTISVLEQNCSSISASADKEMEQMKAVAMNIAHSSLIQDKLVNRNTVYRAPLTSEETAAVQLLLSALIIPNDHGDQVSLYLPTGEIIETGRLSIVKKGNASAQTWYDQVIAKPYHNTFLYMGEDNEIGKFSTGFYSKFFISYLMEHSDSINISKRYIQIKRSMDAVLSSAIHYNSVYGEKVYVVDGYSNLVFPVNSELPDSLACLSTEEMPTKAGLHTSDGNYIFYSPSQHSDFCTVIVISTGELMMPVFEYMGQIACISVLMLLLAVVVSYFSSQRISLPIQEMCEEVTAFDLTNPLQTKELQTNVAELSTLHDAFSDMREKLIDSMNKQLILQSQEMQSRMLALQAQMNPHFLHNSLATIQAMAEENMNEEIVDMCFSISDILRYISSDAEQEVPLQEEIRHACNYLRCMDTRYQGDLTYTINIPDQMKEVNVPKLCIQLMVENAIKYSASSRPPHHISITAVQDEFHHEISVLDNGPGFSQAVLDNLTKKMAEIDESGLLPSLEINGMGLLNIYIRYKLLHKGKIIFRMENCVPHGACVTIGEYYG